MEKLSKCIQNLHILSLIYKLKTVCYVCLIVVARRRKIELLMEVSQGIIQMLAKLTENFYYKILLRQIIPSRVVLNT